MKKTPRVNMLVLAVPTYSGVHDGESLGRKGIVNKRESRASGFRELGWDWDVDGHRWCNCGMETD